MEDPTAHAGAARLERELNHGGQPLSVVMLVEVSLAR